MDSPLVSIVLITWNSARYLPRCLEGISTQTHRNLELIVIDNASTDDSVALVRRRRADATVIQNDTNRGFAAAANQGIAASRGEFVLLCNPDAYLTLAYVEKLVAALEKAGESFGAATGTLLRASGDGITPSEGVDSRGIRMTRSGRHLDIDDERGLRPLHEPQLYEVFGVSGAASMFRRRFLDAIAVAGEIFDEDFFSYREDADVAWRGRIFGWRALSVRDAIAYHVRRVTPERRAQLPAVINMHSVKNRFLLRWKNEGAVLALRNTPFELLRDLVVVAGVLTVERSSMPALRWLWENRRRVMAKRREIQRRRRVSDREIASWFS